MTIIPSRRAFYNVDAELRFLSANDLCLSLWGKTREELIGRSVLEVFPDIAGTDSYAALAQAMKTLKPFRKVVRSPVLHEAIELEVHPSRAGLAVSFARIDTEPSA